MNRRKKRDTAGETIFLADRDDRKKNQKTPADNRKTEDGATTTSSLTDSSGNGGNPKKTSRTPGKYAVCKAKMNHLTKESDHWSADCPLVRKLSSLSLDKATRALSLNYIEEDKIFSINNPNLPNKYLFLLDNGATVRILNDEPLLSGEILQNKAINTNTPSGKMNLTQIKNSKIFGNKCL